MRKKHSSISKYIGLFVLLATIVCNQGVAEELSKAAASSVDIEATDGNRKVQCGAGEYVCVTLVEASTDRQIELKIAIADHWHINAHEPLDDYLIPTVLIVDGATTEDIDYPAVTVKPLSFADADLALYEGAFSLRARRPAQRSNESFEVSLTFQACSENICLPPETLVFELR